MCCLILSYLCFVVFCVIYIVINKIIYGIVWTIFKFICVNESYLTILHCEFELVVKCICVVYNLRVVGGSRHQVGVLKFQFSSFVCSSKWSLSLCNDQIV